MSESISNIGHISPTHPVKPSRETNRDRESEKQNPEQKEPEPDEVNPQPADSDGSADKDQPLLDEYV